MIKTIGQFFLKIGWVSLLFLIFLFPFVNYQIDLASEIFPAFEIIFIYYFISYYNLRSVLILIIGIFLDGFYSVKIGTNSVAFLVINELLKFTSKYFLIKDYATNFIIFCGYCFGILFIKSLLLIYTIKQQPIYSEVFFCYLTTIFSYPLLRLILDKTCIFYQVKFNNVIS